MEGQNERGTCVDAVAAELIGEAEAMESAALQRGTADLAIRVFEAQRATPEEDVERRMALEAAFRECVRVGEPLTADEVAKIEALVEAGGRQ